MESNFKKASSSRLWLLKCCKNKNSYDMKIYFHLMKIILYLIKYILIISPFFHDNKKYFHSIKIILYLIKHIFILSPFFPWYQNIFLFNQNKFLFNKIYFHYITLFSITSKYIFIQSYFFHSSKICFYYTNFSLNTFLVSISGLPFVFTKVRILLSVCKLNKSTRMWILINPFMNEVPIIWKPVYWLAEQIEGLVSIWWGPPSWKI